MPHIPQGSIPRAFKQHQHKMWLLLGEQWFGAGRGWRVGEASLHWVGLVRKVPSLPGSWLFKCIVHTGSLRLKPSTVPSKPPPLTNPPSFTSPCWAGPSDLCPLFVSQPLFLIPWLGVSYLTQYLWLQEKSASVSHSVVFDSLQHHEL